MPVNNESAFLLGEVRRMLGKQIRDLKNKNALGPLEPRDLLQLDQLATTLVKVVRQEKQLTDEDMDGARKLSTQALRKAAKMRGPEPSE